MQTLFHIVNCVLLLLLTSFFKLDVDAAPILNNLFRSGSGTYYAVGLGSCGETNSDNELVAALSSTLMGGLNSALCGKSIQVNSGSKSVTLRVVDSCPGCGENDVDMSQAAFTRIGDLSRGRVPITWSL